MQKLNEKAYKLGATEFGESSVKGKRFYVIYNGKRINFGSNTNNTFIDHHDPQKRKSWRARHSKIQLKDGRYAHKVPEQAEYWSFRILW